LAIDARNTLLVEMTDDVAALVLEDNRLQTLGLSLAEHGAADAVPAQVRVIEMLEAAGRIDRAVDGIDSSAALLRRARDGRGLTRPELAVVLSHGKLALQAAIEASSIASDPLLRPILFAAFPRAMQARFADAIDGHRLRGAIVATKMANRVVNRLGLVAPFELAEEEGVSLAQVAGAYFAIDAIFGAEALFETIQSSQVGEAARLQLFAAAAHGVRLHVADLIRATAGEIAPAAVTEALKPGVDRLCARLDSFLRQEARAQSMAIRQTLAAGKADPALIDRIALLFEADGAIGTASLAARIGADEVAVTQAYVRLGEALGLDWAKSAALRFVPADPWERLLAAGMARDFEQYRLEFLLRSGGTDPVAAVAAWLDGHAPRIAQFVQLVDRARLAPAPTAAMLAQISAQARVLLAR
jgi:glutamate dehydrogenase